MVSLASGHLIFYRSDGRRVLATDPAGKPQPVAEVVQSFKGGLAAGTKVEVGNLPDAEGFNGEGHYLLLLVKDRSSDVYHVAGRQRSPGYDLTGKPEFYPWSADVAKQAAHLFPQD